MRSLPSWRTLVLVAGLVVTATLAMALVRTRAGRVELAARMATVARESAEFDRRAGELRRTVAAQQEAMAEQRGRALMVQSSTDRARPLVGATVARIKADHAARPRPAPLPPPPSPKGSNVDMVFPELMDNPEYARSLFAVRRHSMDHEHRAVLVALGCDAPVVEAAIDLLTEREMLRYDIRSLSPQASTALAQNTERRLRTELEEQLRVLLGDARYAGLAEPGVNVTVMATADGRIVEMRTPGIPVFRTDSLYRSLVSGLTVRLSYSAEPLTRAQEDALVAAFMKLGGNDRLRLMPERWSDPEVAAVFRANLTREQLPAVEALQIEAAAYTQRQKLPKQ